MIMNPTKAHSILLFTLRHLRFIIVLLSALFVISGITLFMNRQGPESIYFQSLEQLGNGNWQEALTDFQHIEHNFPEWNRMVDVYFREGNIYYFYENNIPGAFEKWEKALDATGGEKYDFTIRQRMADIYFNVVADIPEALKEWKYLIKKYPNRPELQKFHFNIANCYIKMNRFESAIIELKNVRSHTKDSHLIQQIDVKLGVIYNLQKNYPQARKILSKVIEHPHCTDCKNAALLALLDTLEAQEDYKKAIEIIKEIPDNVMAASEKKARLKNLLQKAYSRRGK